MFTTACLPAAIDGIVIVAFPLVTLTFVPGTSPPALTPAPDGVVVPVGAALTVTVTVFVIASALLGVIVNVSVLSPVEAEEDAKIVQDIPALCPPDMLEGEQPEEMLKPESEAVILPNCAVVSPEFWILRLKVKVEPCVTLVEVGLTVTEREGAVFTSKEALPESGLHVPETLTDIDCAVALLAVKVVQDTLEPLIALV